jgi:hypothetical protein
MESTYRPMERPPCGAACSATRVMSTLSHPLQHLLVEVTGWPPSDLKDLKDLGDLGRDLVHAEVGRVSGPLVGQPMGVGRQPPAFGLALRE